VERDDLRALNRVERRRVEDLTLDVELRVAAIFAGLGLFAHQTGRTVVVGTIAGRGLSEQAARGFALGGRDAGGVRSADRGVFAGIASTAIGVQATLRALAIGATGQFKITALTGLGHVRITDL